MLRTSPCHLKVRRRYFSSKLREVEARCCKVVRGPQSKRKSSQVSADEGPLSTSCCALRWTVDRRTYAVMINAIRPKAIMTYFLASTTAQPPTLQVMTSERHVGRLIRDFLATTFR